MRVLAAVVAVCASGACGDVAEDDCDAPPTWYADEDGDGFGAAAMSTVACSAPSGHVADDTDCDDADVAINPETVWHLDFDGDGAGHMVVTQVACVQPGGHVLDARDCDDLDPMNRPLTPACPIKTGGISCRGIRGAGLAEGDGAYEVDLDDTGPLPPQTVWCDMTTDGGGWTALINPEAMPTTMGAGATFVGSEIGGTGGSCTGAPSEIIRNGSRGLTHYRCGDQNARLTIDWPNLVGATDVMFVAVAHGQSATFQVNGTTIAENGSTVDANAAICRFWNGNNLTMSAAQNQCYTTYLDAAPIMHTQSVAGAFQLQITAGPACAPNCNYGAGMNIQRLFVR